ncbi:MAG: metallophosphoesterase [Chloroflexi bacterium]|nr:metallophosphoesterase [Chloroflexota bacterium]
MKLPRFQIKLLHWLAIISVWLTGTALLARSSSNAAAQTSNIVFAVIGDFGDAGQPEADVASLVKSWNPSFIITVGDNNYPDGAASTVDQNIGQYYHDYIFKYSGKFGSGSAVNRFFPALGNHDWDQNNGRQQELYFTLPGNERYYDFTQGPLHFFVLNSNATEPDGITVDSKQAKWLKSGLAASTSKFDIVVMHHPPYSSGRHGSTKAIQWPFKLWGAEAVLAGHDHLYERLLVDGLPYFVNGIGGAEKLYYFQSALPESKIRYNQDYGAMRVEASSQSMKFQLYTRAGILIDEYTIGTTPPVVSSILRVNANPANSPSVDFAVTFSEAVSGVDVTDFNLTATNPTGASILTVSGYGSRYIISAATGPGDNSLRLDLVDNDSITNSLGVKLGDAGIGNGNYASGETYSIDKTPPSVISIIRASASPTNAASLDFAVTFSESVSGVDVSDFNLLSNSGASINGTSGTGNIYTVSVNTAISTDSLRLDFADDNSVADLAGNKMGGAGNFSSGETYTVDRTAPSVTSIVRASPSPTTASSVDFLVTFSEPVLGLDSFDFKLTAENLSGASKASIGSVNGAGNAFTVTVNTDLTDDTLRLDLTDNDSVTDLLGNALGGSFSSGEIYQMDKSAPSVTSIIRASPNPSSSTSVDFIVTFSESVAGVDVSDFNLSTSNISGASISGVDSFDPFYVVSVNTGNGDGTLRLDLIDDDSIVHGNSLGGAGLGNGNFVSGEIYTIDKTPPVVTSIIRASANPSNSVSVDFIVTFSESVSGVDSTDFSVTAENISRASILGVKGFDPFYIVSVNTGIGTGTLRLDLVDDDSIADKANNKIGGSDSGNGAFTAGEIFNIAKSPVNFPPPINREPRKNLLTNNSNISFSWSPVRGALAYELMLASDANFNNLIFSRVVDGSSFTASAPFDGKFFWHVRAYNSSFQAGRFSATQSFTVDTTPPAAPTLVSPTNNSITSRRPNLKWNAVGEAVNYQVEVDDNPNFNSPEFTSIKRGVSIRTSSLAKKVYFWRVRAKDAAGNWSDWSEIFTFIAR